MLSARMEKVREALDVLASQARSSVGLTPKSDEAVAAALAEVEEWEARMRNFLAELEEMDRARQSWSRRARGLEVERDGLLVATERDRLAEGREGMVTVYDHEDNYLGCMGINLWRALLDARAASVDEGETP